ncbi:MAG: hypothetical protein A2086_14815 [Spirochaetes bacterium GWD1_27_9]|nr:MAG: hypothetical protein A2Z98_11525 [Spirochaetes bacterium GWB1_27_13]OHD21002.1 MAG: hypothetical protein A2Y34_12010 [Spirochaetes bacterium GWC1_27_15]OHD45365.1 MAG: hypothetical protein A2086_14815 [Spirochaetes bacterium GWD1_27_9]
MKILLNLLKYIFFIFVFLICKITSSILDLNNIFLFIFIEGGMLFILAFLFLIFTDSSQNQNIFFASLIVSLIFLFLVSILFVVKYFFQNEILIGLINYISFILFGSLPLIKDKIFYSETKSYIFIVDFCYIFYFLVIKLIFNILLIIVFPRFGIEVENINFILISIFASFIFFIKPIILATLVKGYILYNDKKYPLLENFKVGKSKNCNIVITDTKIPKSCFFTIFITKKWHITPSTIVELNDKKIESKTSIADQDEIRVENHSFVISQKKGFFLKRLFLFFTFNFIVIFSFFGDENQTPVEEQIKNINFYQYSTIDVFLEINDNQIKKEDFFIVENSKKALIKNFDPNFKDIDLVLILDITGSMYDEYQKTVDNFRILLENIKKKRERLRCGIITFADNENDITILKLTEDIGKVSDYIKNIQPESGGDFCENPYDAIFRLNDFKFSNNSQKVVILFTDAPPHIKGDKASKGKDFTSKTTQDVEKYINFSSFLFYVVSYERFEEYQELIDYNTDNFFDIEKYSDYSEILGSIENSLKKVVKLSYYSTTTKDAYENLNFRKKINVFYKENAIKMRKIVDINNLKKLSFFESLFGNF